MTQSAEGNAKPRSAKLYTPRLLALSAGLAEFPLVSRYEFNAEARSRTCGSSIKIGFDCSADDRVDRIGMQVTACAIGQSSAAILAQSAKGRGKGEFQTMCDAIDAWLKGEGAAPDWPGFDALEPALDHAGRHGALMLPWRAAAEALSTGTVSS